MNTIQFQPVGMVAGNRLVINTEYLGGLLNIGECEYLDVVYYFHESENKTFPLSGITRSGAERGVFASRSPNRPNLIGITTVKLLEIKANELVVEGLDAKNGSPLLDIKCCDTSLFAQSADKNPVHQSIIRSEPRIEIKNHILRKETELLLTKAGQLHGHYCPGLAMGIMAAAFAMSEMRADSDGMEDLLAITETNNCFADGVQFVTGCSFGNNGLIYKDLGKTAFTLTKRDGKGIRVCSRPESQEVLHRSFPAFRECYGKVVTQQNHDPELVAEFKKLGLERAFGTLTIPFGELFDVQHVTTDIPSYASIRESVVCATCKESVMINRTVTEGTAHYCYRCAGTTYPILTGDGISVQ